MLQNCALPIFQFASVKHHCFEVRMLIIPRYLGSWFRQAQASTVKFLAQSRASRLRIIPERVQPEFQITIFREQQIISLLAILVSENQVTFRGRNHNSFPHTSTHFLRSDIGYRSRNNNFGAKKCRWRTTRICPQFLVSPLGARLS